MSTSGAPAVRRPDGGQATVEVALVLPLLVMVTLGVVQVAVVAAQQLGILHAAREAARAAAVDADAPGAASAAATRATEIAPLAVSTAVHDGLVTVTVTYDAPTDVPLIGPLLPTVTLRAAVTMARDPPPGGG